MKRAVQRTDVLSGSLFGTSRIESRSPAANETLCVRSLQLTLVPEIEQVTVLAVVAFMTVNAQLFGLLPGSFESRTANWSTVPPTGIRCSTLLWVLEVNPMNGAE